MRLCNQWQWKGGWKWKIDHIDNVLNRPRPKHGHRYTKYKMCLIIMMVIDIKQHLSNIWSSIQEKLSNTEAELKKSVAYKKSVY